MDITSYFSGSTDDAWMSVNNTTDGSPEHEPHCGGPQDLHHQTLKKKKTGLEKKKSVENIIIENQGHLIATFNRVDESKC